MPRKILHLDLDAFFCSVEELRDPSLRGKAFAVGGEPDKRGVVASCSYPARRHGVHSAMPMREAVRRCPGLLIVPHHRSAYSDASRQVMAYLRSLTPLVEQLSIDEAFLDVTALPQEAETLARQVQQRINGEFHLPCSLGVASNKLVAKIANNIGKDTVKADAGTDNPPNAILVVPPGEEAAFLAPLPARQLWGVGPKTAERLGEIGIHTIGDLVTRPEIELVQRFGKHGYDLARHARGLDDRPVESESETKSISRETTFERDVNDHELLRRMLLELCEGVGQQLRHEELRGSTVKLKLRWSDFTTLTRQTTLKARTDQDIDVYQAALALLQKTWNGKRAIRLIGVGVSNFAPVTQQLELWDGAPENVSPKNVAEPPPLKNALDNLRGRYGDQIVRRGRDVKG
ncbi:MAG TPA: DNA polymerase IV [Aggregatilineales bacterium]|nr:DNA polymerase IV [Aggregatilineales bacterium]